jgi:hypothetical protein
MDSGAAEIISAESVHLRRSSACDEEGKTCNEDCELAPGMHIAPYQIRTPGHGVGCEISLKYYNFGGESARNSCQPDQIPKGVGG